MSHLEREAPDWLNVSFLFVQASCLGEELWTNGRAVVRMQLWSRKKQPIVPGTSEKCDLLLAGSVCLAQRRTDR